MAEKPPEEGYISVVDEEPEILQLLKWNNPPQIHKQHEQRCVETVPVQAPEKPTSPEKRPSKPQECDPFDLLDPDFIETYRLSKELARGLIEELKPVMPDSTKGTDFPVESKVLAALIFYATGKFQKVIAGKTDPNITNYFVTSAVIQVTEAMNHPTIVKKYIHFPHLREERDIIKARFYMKYGVPDVVGCVECTHVPLARPDDDRKSHFNKSYHSKKVQIICDSDHNIISVDPSPGAHSHDGILGRHAVRVDLDSLNHSGEQCWLVGGPFYNLKPYVMTPIPKITKKSPVSPEKYFNTVHSQIHTVVMDTIKHLKSRWKCLQATCNKQYDPATMSMMVVACCVLHNICNRIGLTICPMTQAEERLEAMKQKVANGSVPKKVNEDEDGKRVRALLVERIWNERRIAPEANGPKKRAKKDRLQGPGQVQIQQVQQIQGQSHQSHEDDASKRPRMAMNPPTYGMMPSVTVWGHYPPHH